MLFRSKRAGKVLMEHQLTALCIHEMHMLTEALRSYVMRTAWQHDAGEHSFNAGMVMNYSTDIIQRVTRLNMCCDKILQERCGNSRNYAQRSMRFLKRSSLMRKIPHFERIASRFLRPSAM